MSKKKRSFLGVISTSNNKVFKNKKGLALLGIIILAILFLLFSSSSPSSKDSSLFFEEDLRMEEYVSRLETRLKSIISSVSNTGKTDVMITLDESAKYVYQSNINSTASNDIDSEGVSKESREDEETTVIVKNSDGNEVPVLKSKLSPRISGVLVICEGGGRADVKENVSKAVRALLGIPSNKICVLKKN